VFWYAIPKPLMEGCLITGIAFIYAFNKEMTFLIKVKSKEKIKITERIFKRISKVLISFYYIIQILEKGNTITRIFFLNCSLKTPLKPVIQPFKV
jgi:hypothetical protein